MVAMVVFVVLTFVSAGAAVWLYQKSEMSAQALRDNQAAFEENVATFFQERKWDLPREEGAGVLGVRYSASTYGAVRGRLGEAVSYEEIAPLLGWQSAEGIRTSLGGSAAQSGLDRTTAETVRALLTSYEQAYKASMERIQELESQRDAAKKQLEERSNQLAEVRRDMMSKIAAITEEHARKLKQWVDNYNESLNIQRQEREALQEWKRDREKELSAVKANMASVQKQVSALKEKQEKLRAGKKKEVFVFKPEGKVLAVKRDFNLVVLQGGRNVGRKTGETFVVFEEELSGARKEKAKVKVTDVEEHTVSTAVISETGRVRKGDLFASVGAWQKYLKAPGKASSR